MWLADQGRGKRAASWGFRLSRKEKTRKERNILPRQFKLSNLLSLSTLFYNSFLQLATDPLLIIQLALLLALPVSARKPKVV